MKVLTGTIMFLLVVSIGHTQTKTPTPVMSAAEIYKASYELNLLRIDGLNITISDMVQEKVDRIKLVEQRLLLLDAKISQYATFIKEMLAAFTTISNNDQAFQIMAAYRNQFQKMEGKNEDQQAVSNR